MMLFFLDRGRRPLAPADARLPRARWRLISSAVLLFVGLLRTTPTYPQESAPQGRVSGRVLDREQGSPIPLAIVRVSSGPAAPPVSAIADSAGRYSVALPGGSGPLQVRAERIGYLPLTVVVPAEEAASGSVWRDLRLTPRVVSLPPLSVSQARRAREESPRRTPGANDDAVASWLPTEVPLAPGDLAELAGLHGGVQVLEGGVSFMGQDPSQTRTTLDGAGFGSTSLPQEALAGTSIVGSTYDASRGQFSSGMIAARSLGGTNLFGAALRSRLSHPGLQWAGYGPPSDEPEPSLAYVDAGAGGAIVPNRAFWYLAVSATRRRAPLVSLESASPAVLRGRGVDPDTARRAAALLRSAGAVPGVGGGGEAGMDGSSGLLRLDYDISRAHAVTVRLDGRRTRIGGLGAGPLTTAGSSGAVRLDGGGVMAQLASRIGKVDNELRAYGAGETRRLLPEHALPAATVWVAAGDSAGGSTVLRFGGAPVSGGAEARMLEVSNDLVAGLGKSHELKAGVMFSEEDATLLSPGNALGTFSFHGLEDFQAGRPASFTRTLGSAASRARARYGALYVGDTWRAGRFGLTAGARLEGRWYPGDDRADSLASAFGMEVGRVPSEVGLSPRLGWSYAGTGWYVFGGAGEFRGRVPVPSLASALGEGSGSGTLTLSCVGAATPVPDWRAFGESPESVPTSCDGGSTSAGGTPSLTGFAGDFAAPRAWRASIGGRVPVADLLTVQFDASLVRGRGNRVARDRNVAEAAAFRLAEEAGRPVHAPPGAIDPRTGGLVPGLSRPFAEWSAIREISSRGRSSAAQLRADVALGSPTSRRARAPHLSGSYTFTRARDQVGGLAALHGSVPLAVDPAVLTGGPSDLEREHDVQLRLSYAPVSWARLGALARFVSGAPFTPRVDGDVNGDGSYNDPAFVFDPDDVADPALARGISALLRDAPDGVRRCLRRQMGRVARRNSCRGGWSSSLDARADFEFLRSGVSRRLRVTVSTSNAASLVDRLVNGREGMRGWGETPLADPVLLRVRGFDPQARSFRYEVNPRFGARNGALAGSRRPFGVTVEGRIAVGSDPAYQAISKVVNRALGAGRSLEEIRHALAARIPNVPAQVVSLDSAARLGLTPDQRRRLGERAGEQGARLAPLADSLALAVSDLESRRRSPREAQRQIQRWLGEIGTVLDGELAAVRAILTREQWEKLPEGVRDPSRQIVPPPRSDVPVTIGG